MRLKILATCIGLGSLFLNHHAIAASSHSITYKNQRNSIMTLKWNDNTKNTGNLDGTFTTAVGNCKKDIGVPLPLTGYFNGNVISISINFPHCQQTVAMTGNLSNNQSQIHTLWLDANQADDPRGKIWNSNIIGSDSFEKIG